MGIQRERDQFNAGLIHAMNVVAKDGVKALKEEIKFRGVYHAPCTESRGQLEKWISEISNNIYNCMLADVGVTLDADFGFRKQRMQKFRECYEKRARQTLDMNWIGNHYVTLEDYAKYMNDLYGWAIDDKVCKNCQENADKETPAYKMVKLERLVAELSSHGFGDAADWILKEWKDY